MAATNLSAVLPAGAIFDGTSSFSWRSLRDELGRAARAHSLAIGVVLAHMCAALVLPPLFGVPNSYSPTVYVTTILALTGLAAVVFLLTYTAALAMAEGPRVVGPRLRKEMTQRILTPERLCQTAVMLLLFPVFAATFSYFKVAIPDLHPFAWDVRLAALDRFLHGGVDPWMILQPVLGHPFVTAAINAAYHLWFGAAYGAILWMMVDTRRRLLRMRFLLTFLLTWILLGNLAATVFSSAGPVYFGRVTGLADPFAPLMAYLNAANEAASVPALEIQELLWRWYRSGAAMAGAGISAMPSVHVGVAFSFFLLGRAISPRLGYLGAAFAAIILIGSVHLGWHYAVDGYVAIVLTWVIWRGVGWLLTRPAIGVLLGLNERSS